MTISQYKQLFNNILESTTKKSEARIFKKFIAVLTDLELRDLGIDAHKAIEQELDRLELDTAAGTRKKSFQHGFIKFTNFLKKEYNLITQGYYTNKGLVLGMTMGIGIGLAVGTSIDPANGAASGLSMGIGFGMAFGIAIGAFKDKEAVSQGRVIKLK